MQSWNPTSHFKSHFCLFETFRWDLKWDVLLETLETFSNLSCFLWDLKWDIRNFWNLKLFKPITGVGYLKLSDATWNEMCYLKLFNFFKPITKAAYLKLSDETWNKCYLKILKLETFTNMSWELLIWNFQMRLEMRCAIWNFWNLKLLEPIMGSCLFETFRWDLKWDVLFETFQPFQTHHKSCLFETFRWDLKWDVLFETWNFSNWSCGLLSWNFQIRLEQDHMLFENFETWNFSNPSQGVAYLKLSDETSTRGAIWNFWNLKLFKSITGGFLFETFRWDLKWDVLFETFETWNFAVWNYLKLLTCHLRTKKFQLTLNLEVINLLVHRVDICC